MTENQAPALSENDRRWLLIRAKLNEENLVRAVKHFRAGGIEPILIKGWAAAREYPDPARRVFTDIDFCVPPARFEAARALIEKEEHRRLNVDLHAGLRHLDTHDWDDLFANSRLVPLGAETIRVLRPEDHLRVLCVHWLTDGGAYREKLEDFYRLLENNAAVFDWDRALGGISPTRRGWIVKTIAVTRRFYPLDTSRMPFAGELEEIPAWFLRALEKEWASGTKLIPLHAVLGDRKVLWQQIRKRVPPNAIQATVDLEGPLDGSARLPYQIGSVFVRLSPSLKRVYEVLKNGGRRKV